MRTPDMMSRWSVRGPGGAVAIMTMIVATLVSVLHGPIVTLALTGDSYQWLQHAHLAAHDPHFLFTDLDGFFRPSATWLLVIDRVLWGGFNAAGYRTTSLLLHALTAVLLAVAGRRLGLGWGAAGAVAVVWATSPFTDESVFVVACRHELLLMIPWLAMILVWPGPGARWGARRTILLAVAYLLAAAAKETWVVTPLLAAALEIERTRSIRRALAPTVISGLAVATYVVFYLALFHNAKPYLEPGPHVVAKIPNMLASFLYLEPPMVDGPTLTWKGLLAITAIAGVAVSALRWRTPGALVATVLLIAPTLPVLLVPYMPQRYMTIPFAGFVLLIALFATRLAGRRPGWHRWLRVSAATATVIATGVGAVLVRADLADYRQIAAAHRRLLAEAAAVVDLIDFERPIIVVRDETVSPLQEVVGSPAGLPKLAFIRNYDPYGLIDTAALFEWVLADEGTGFEHVIGWRTSCSGSAGEVLIHRTGGFAGPDPASDVAVEAGRWLAAGRGVQVVRSRSLDASRPAAAPQKAAGGSSSQTGGCRQKTATPPISASRL